MAFANVPTFYLRKRLIARLIRRGGAKLRNRGVRYIGIRKQLRELPFARRISDENSLLFTFYEEISGGYSIPIDAKLSVGGAAIILPCLIHCMIDIDQRHITGLKNLKA